MPHISTAKAPQQTENELENLSNKTIFATEIAK